MRTKKRSQKIKKSKPASGDAKKIAIAAIGTAIMPILEEVEAEVEKLLRRRLDKLRKESLRIASKMKVSGKKKVSPAARTEALALISHRFSQMKTQMNRALNRR